MNHVLEHGYEGWFVTERGLRPLSEFVHATHQRPLLHDVLARAYVNNFIFVHRPPA